MQRSPTKRICLLITCVVVSERQLFDTRCSLLVLLTATETVSQSLAPVAVATENVSQSLAPVTDCYWNCFTVLSTSCWLLLKLFHRPYLLLPKMFHRTWWLLLNCFTVLNTSYCCYWNCFTCLSTSCPVLALWPRTRWLQGWKNRPTPFPGQMS